MHLTLWVPDDRYVVSKDTILCKLYKMSAAIDRVAGNKILRMQILLPGQCYHFSRYMWENGRTMDLFQIYQKHSLTHTQIYTNAQSLPWSSVG